MDLWIVAAATGAGYLAKYWNKISKNSGSTFQLPFSSEDPKVDNSESLSCPFARWRDGSGKDFSSNVYLQDDPLSGELASAAFKGHDSEKIRGSRTFNKSSGLSLSNLSLPISPNESSRDIEDVNEHSSNIDSNYGFQFSDSSAEVGSKYSAGSKISLRTRHLHGPFIRPVSSLESCLLAQLCKEHARLEEYVFSSRSSPSIATRSFLVSDGNRIISRKSIDSSSSLVQSEGCKLHDEDFREKDENVIGIPSLPKMGSLEDPKMKIKVGKGSSGRLSFSNNVFGRKHMHSQHDAMFLFSLGISYGMIASTLANKREVENLRGLLKQTENLVQDLHDELEMKDSVSVKELHNENYGPPEMYDHSSYEKDMSQCSPEKHIGASPRNNNNELHNHREEESPLSMSKIEAELEAELERLGLTMNASSLVGRLSEFAEIDPEFEADFVQGELRTDVVNGKAFAHQKSNDDTSDIGTPHCSSYAVSPHELSLRLHEIIQFRLEERVKELEVALENSQWKLQMMESKLEDHYPGEFSGYGQASGSLTGETSSAYDEWDRPLVVNLTGEALDAYNEAYEEIIKRNDSEENSPSGIYAISPKEGSHSHGRRASGIQLGEAYGSVIYSEVNGEKMSGETASNQVTMLEGQSSGVGGEIFGIDYEKELIMKIVERTRKGSPVFQNAQRVLDSIDEDEN